MFLTYKNVMFTFGMNPIFFLHPKLYMYVYYRI